MRILVTGGAGFIGSHLVERLSAGGHSVRVLDNLSTGKRENLRGVDDVDFVVGDVCAVIDVDRAMEGMEAVFHLAAVASVQASVEDPVGTHGSNFMGTLNLLEAARRRRIRRFIYASSAAVYGETRELPVSEETAVCPLSPYAADKLAGEHYLLFYARKYGLAATAFRFFNVYGPRQDPSSPYSGVISIFTQRIRAGEPVTIYGDGTQTRDFIYVADLAEILYRSLDNTKTDGQVLNVGRGIECSLLEILAELERLSGTTVERRYRPARIGDIYRSCAAIERLVQLLGYKPPTPVAEGLHRLLEYNANSVR
jgi:UDP-glucose 4-epimerase